MPRTSDKPPIIAIVGFTASGKTGLSLDLAQALGGEVINTDSMQVYRGMDIGTAKLRASERRGIPHHLLDLLDVTEPLTVAEFQGWATESVSTLREAGSTPVLVGGSALYTRAITDGLAFQETDPEVRARWEAELARVGEQALHRHLATVDPTAATTIPAENGRRVVRALEVIELTGQPYAASMPELAYADPLTVQIGLAIDRPTLDARIEQRVQQMFDAGFVAEVEALLARGLAQGRTASRAIGYREVAAYLAGELSLAQAQERTVIRTRQFARRQDAWFKRDHRIEWVPYDSGDLLSVATSIIESLTTERTS